MKKAKNKVAPGVVEIFLDGACQGNPGPGGYAAILRFGGSEKEITGCHPQTTNNRMELMAAIKALEQLSRPCKVRIYTDSNYLVKGITGFNIEGGGILMALSVGKKQLEKRQKKACSK